MTTQPATDYDWPQEATAALLAGLAATRDADQEQRFARLLGGAK